MLAPILQVSSAQVLQRSDQPNQFDYLAKGVSQDVNDKLAGARPQRHRHHPVGGERLRPVAGPGPVLRRQPARFRQRRRRRPVRRSRATTTRILSGVNGHESTLTDVNGNAIVLGEQQKVAAKNGDNLELGLDSQIQYDAEIALANGVNRPPSRRRGR